uniref:Protein kinase domain-containing protein n=2 Tax=Aegilops tauschii subsp. strangulata TaxID=200361 RepID=A0A453F2L2_AEGTS
QSSKIPQEAEAVPSQQDKSTPAQEPRQDSIDPSLSRPSIGMEQLRQLGEVVGSINALMAFEADLRINPRQCRLLAETCAHALDAVTGNVRAHLRFDERGSKWRALESPLRELHRALRDAEGYVRQCLDPRGSWWARAAAMAHGTECVEHHLHNILWCVSVAVDAIEAAGEIAGSEPDDHARARLLLANKYDRDMLEPKLFQLALGKRYLVSRELVVRMDAAWKEDRWALSQLLDEMTGPAAPKRLSKNEHRLAEVLAAPRGRLHPASILLGGDYSVRRRLGGRLKEVQWMGESFAMKHFIGDGEAVGAEVELLASVAHPNVAHATYCFHDEERKEYFVVMDQLMAKDLGSYVKEVSCPRRRTPFPVIVAIDIMLQIARGMEYLHAKGIYHGELNPSNVLVRLRQPDGGYVQVKVTGFGQSGIAMGANVNGDDNACIWYAPEVLKPEVADAGSRRTEKADVYSFAMICFELLTGKVPFEDNHLQGDKTSKNIRAGERPLFPFQTPKYLTALTKRCWHADPEQRPGFSSVCRVLRYVKRFLVMNPEQQQQQAAQGDEPVVPPVDYLDVEMQLLRRLPAWQRGEGARVPDLPFQMFAYKVLEREKTAGVVQAKDRAFDSGSEGNLLYGDENGVGAMSPDHPSSAASNGAMRPLPDSSDGKKPPSAKKADGKAARQPVAGHPQKVKPANPARTPQAPRRTLGVKTDGVS